MEMKIVRLAFSREVMIKSYGIPSALLKEMLDLMPSDTKLVGCGHDSTSCVDYMFFTSDSFKEVPMGCSVPDVYARFVRRADGSVFAESIDFGNQPKIVGCSHIWTTHSGLRDSYDYCTLCNTRRNP